MGPLSSAQWYMAECTLTSNLLETWQMIWDVLFKLGNCLKICPAWDGNVCQQFLYPSCLWVIHSYWPDCKTENFLLIKLSGDKKFLLWITKNVSNRDTLGYSKYWFSYHIKKWKFCQLVSLNISEQIWFSTY